MKKLEVFTSEGGARYVKAPRAEVVAETKFDVELGIAGMRELFDDESAGIVDYGEMDYEAGSETLSQFAGQLCFDEETEILTNSGWRRFRDAHEVEKVMTLNPTTAQLEWGKPKAWHQYDYVGDLFYVEGRDVDFAVTPDHRQWAQWGSDQTYKFAKTSELATTQFKILTAPPNGWTGRWPDTVTIPDVEKTQAVANQHTKAGTKKVTMAGRVYSTEKEIEALAILCAYYATEGTLATGVGGAVVIYGDHYAGVRAVCDTLQLPTSVWMDKRNNVLRIAVGGGQPLRAYMEQHCGKLSPNKKLPNWVTELPTEQLQKIWKLLVETDGHQYAAGGEVLCSTSATLVDQAQEILLKLGFTGTPGMYAGTNYPMLAIRKKIKPVAQVNKSVLMERRHYSGQVHCVTTDNGIVLVRRNGIPHLSGNCYLSFGEKRTPLAENKKYLERIMESAHGSVFEHSSYSVLFFGIDRATTHELVRHRAGTAFSQVSQRYVDDEHLRFVMPYEYNGSSKLIAQFERRIDRAVEDYRVTSHELREVIKRNDGESSTEYRKRIQSCSREVLPNCTEAPIIVTANVRAWRHIFSMRCSAHADVRIRRPMIEVLQSLRLKAPNLFSDFEFEQLRDGTLAAASRYPKV